MKRTFFDVHYKWTRLIADIDAVCSLMDEEPAQQGISPLERAREVQRKKEEAMTRLHQKQQERAASHSAERFVPY